MSRSLYAFYEYRLTLTYTISPRADSQSVFPLSISRGATRHFVIRMYAAFLFHIEGIR
jgi:hypothetical protein